MRARVIRELIDEIRALRRDRADVELKRHTRQLARHQGRGREDAIVARSGGGMPIDHLRAVCENIRAQTQGRAPRGVRHDDADAEVGTFGSDDAIGFDPFPMLAVMPTSGASYAVFGQVAGILHGSSEPTGDLDILWDGSADGVDGMVHAFQAAGVVLRDEDFNRLEPADYRTALAGAKVYFEGRSQQHRRSLHTAIAMGVA